MLIYISIILINLFELKYYYMNLHKFIYFREFTLILLFLFTIILIFCILFITNDKFYNLLLLY